MKLFPALMYAASGTATGEAPSMTETLISPSAVCIGYYRLLFCSDPSAEKARQGRSGNA